MPASLTGLPINTTYSQLLHIPTLDATLRAIYTGNGTVTPIWMSTTAFGVDNLKFDGNTIVSTDTDGAINLSPNGTGSVVISKVAITDGTITALSTPLPVAAGGTGGATAGDARTALGLGTIATQASSAVAITGGAISGVTLSGSGGATLSATLVRSVDTLGYAVGAGGTVTQTTDKSTGVTLNKCSGQITMHAANLTATTSVSFTLTNSQIAATDVVIVNIASAGTANSYALTVDAVAAGSCRIQLRNVTGGGLAEALVVNFAVLKGASA